jgi:hypothetical protein
MNTWAEAILELAAFGAGAALLWCCIRLVVEWKRIRVPEKRAMCDRCGLSSEESKLVGVHNHEGSETICRHCWGLHEQIQRELNQCR